MEIMQLRKVLANNILHDPDNMTIAIGVVCFRWAKRKYQEFIQGLEDEFTLEERRDLLAGFIRSVGDIVDTGEADEVYQFMEEVNKEYKDIVEGKYGKRSTRTDNTCADGCDTIHKVANEKV